MRILECFTRTIRWVPSVFVTGVVLWSYYAYVVELCIMTVQINWERIVYLTLYHPILFLFVWSYWQTVFTDPLHPRQEYFLTVEEVHKVSLGWIPKFKTENHTAYIRGKFVKIWEFMLVIIFVICFSEFSLCMSHIIWVT